MLAASVACGNSLQPVTAAVGCTTVQTLHGRFLFVVPSIADSLQLLTDTQWCCENFQMPCAETFTDALPVAHASAMCIVPLVAATLSQAWLAEGMLTAYITILTLVLASALVRKTALQAANVLSVIAHCVTGATCIG